jgi:hypothetical protein
MEDLGTGSKNVMEARQKYRDKLGKLDSVLNVYDFKMMRFPAVKKGEKLLAMYISVDRDRTNSRALTTLEFAEKQRFWIKK